MKKANSCKFSLKFSKFFTVARGQGEPYISTRKKFCARISWTVRCLVFGIWGKETLLSGTRGTGVLPSPSVSGILRNNKQKTVVGISIMTNCKQPLRLTVGRINETVSLFFFISRQLLIIHEKVQLLIGRILRNQRRITLLARLSTSDYQNDGITYRMLHVSHQRTYDVEIIVYAVNLT